MLAATIAATTPDAGLATVEIGALALVLAALAWVAARLGITAIPLYLIAGLAVGTGGVAPLDVSADFIHVAGEIGVLLLLLTLGLEYGPDELRTGMRVGAVPAVVDAVANFCPGFVVGLMLGWAPSTAVLLGGVCWVSSSGVVSKVLADMGSERGPEHAGVLNLLVVEDLAMAVFLPVMAAVLSGTGALDMAVTVGIALAAVGLFLTIALRWGNHLSRFLSPLANESLLLAVFGLTLVVGGLAQAVQVSAAIGAFLVGLALSGSVQGRAGALVSPLRDLFAATFFVSFSFTVDASDLVRVALPAVALAALGVIGKLIAGWFAARPHTEDRMARLRTGAVLIARGEFSVIVAALGVGTADGAALAATAAAYVLITAIVGPVAARFVRTPERSTVAAACYP